MHRLQVISDTVRHLGYSFELKAAVDDASLGGRSAEPQRRTCQIVATVE